ncbi:hypothetical protein BDY17DRAFT_322546 [Neohortaea acidophila]|uniref:C2H2-type domain-containing protein n=1 Tax=Neohortaea acidophila TaxID=245834 RepID=A0A6A6Q159_9PEZI|nr:uncharacterized protein BDY17DRAFT_322546 [Neohortaea acidophila]KAF2485726.1 hypothetical protein BDY17DRAFT_322546 [Neohortaea acidophila]
MDCLLPPHKPLNFETYAEYESHYHQAHTNRCTECKSNFPTSQFLELHIAEHHDPIVASKRDGGARTYGCFVEGCEKICADWKKRRSHLVDKHGYPKNYDFMVVDHGVDGRSSMLRPGVDAQGHRRSSRERGRSDSSVSAAAQTTDITSMSEPNAGSSMGKVATEGDGVGDAGKEESGLDELTSSMSALKMVPRSVTFGTRKGRTGFAKS